MVNLRLPWLQEQYSQGNIETQERILDVLVVVKLFQTLKHVINVNSQKSFTGLWSDARASLSLFFFFFGAGLLMSFHRHICPSIMIICIQLQTWGGSGYERRCGNFLFEQLWWCPPGSRCPTQTAYSAYRERRYCIHISDTIIVLIRVLS